MGTTKRERQRAARLEKTAAEIEAAKRAKAKRTALRIVIAAVVVLAILFGVSELMGNDDDDAETSPDDATETTAPATTEPVDENGIDGSDGSGEFAYGTTPCPPATGADEPTLSFDDGFEQCIDPARTYTATFTTSEGDVVVELDTATTPGTTNNFVALARNRYYDSTELFRTDPGIGIIQGGSPHSNDPSDQGPGYSLPDEGGVFEFSPDGQGTGPFTYAPGQLIMARSGGPDGAGAQFFFSVDENVTQLDSQGTYVTFGSVTEGLDVLEAIMALHEDDPTSPLGGGPSRPVTVETVTITES
ncbi:MAG: peptidylprolyl isomerase [Acidimicrobiales bacterium]|nr:peptidylprolyl isomerase [Acidimicrobiales bacterium]